MEEMKLRNDYKDTFREIQTPENLVRKVNKMTKVKTDKTRMTFMNKFAVTAVAIVVLFVSSNVVAYAATGSTWLEKVIVMINGIIYQVDLELQENEDGTTFYEGMIIGGADGPTAVIITGNTDPGVGVYEISVPGVIEEEGKVYFVDGDVKIDITKDLEDGKATGVYIKDGSKSIFEVTGREGAWEFSVSDYKE